MTQRTGYGRALNKKLWLKLNLREVKMESIIALRSMTGLPNLFLSSRKTTRV